MKYIKLNNSSECAICDDGDYSFLNLFQWHLTSNGHAATWGDDGTEILMEWVVLNRDNFYVVDFGEIQ